MTQIMWKEIAIGFIILYVLRNLLDVYIVRKGKKLVGMFGKLAGEKLKPEIESHLKLCNFFSVGPWNKPIYATHNALCWLLASIYLMEGKEEDFLVCLHRIKRENEYEIKTFALALFYKSKGKEDKAKYYYDAFLKCTREDEGFKVIMDSVFAEPVAQEQIKKAVDKYSNPALIKLFKDNGVVE